MAEGSLGEAVKYLIFVVVCVLIFIGIVALFIYVINGCQKNNKSSTKEDKIKEFFSNLFQKKKPKERQIIRRRDCKNTPINFKRKYDKFPDMYNINKIPSPGLGANSRMVALGKGSCHSNVNGVNKLAKFNEYGRIYSNGGNQSYAFCVPGSDNFFDEE